MYSMRGTGYYWGNGDIYRVVRGLGDTHAERLVISAEGTRATFVYAVSGVLTLDAEDRLSEVQAVEFGREHGLCALCGRALRGAQDVERSIGAICARKQGW